MMIAVTAAALRTADRIMLLGMGRAQLRMLLCNASIRCNTLPRIRCNSVISWNIVPDIDTRRNSLGFC